MAAPKDETGNSYGLLTVIAPAGKTAAGALMWKCQCKCGNTPNVVGQNLRNHNTLSCGCERKSVVGGRGAHKRVEAARGKASSHLCTCGDMASDWAYNHSDPDQLINEYGHPYSLNTENYNPMCRPCHIKMDKNRNNPKESE